MGKRYTRNSRHCRTSHFNLCNEFLLCTYIKSDGSQPEQLFKLEWAEVSGRHYDFGNRYPDSLTIITKMGKQYSFFRVVMLAKQKDFPGRLAELAPDDIRFGKWYLKPNKTLRQLSDVLASHHVPKSKLAYKN